MKSRSYISWDEYFMGVAVLSANRKDPNTKVGACIVNPENALSVSAIMVFLMAAMMMFFLGVMKVISPILNTHMLFTLNLMRY